MNKKYCIVAIVSSLFYQSVNADPVITFFFQQYPLLSDYGPQISQSLQKPGKIAKATVFGLRNEHIAGIITTYAGFLDTSSLFGQVTFPRKHEKPSITFIIADKIMPVLMVGNTVHHWEIERNIPAAAYRAQRKQDQDSKAYYWDVQAIEIPDNNHIPINAILILAKPKNIYIPQGITLTADSPNLILPNIYIKKGIKQAANALYFLNLKHFFRQLQFLYHKEPSRYSRQLAM